MAKRSVMKMIDHPLYSFIVSAGGSGTRRAPWVSQDEGRSPRQGNGICAQGEPKGATGRDQILFGNKLYVFKYVKKGIHICPASIVSVCLCRDIRRG